MKLLLLHMDIQNKEIELAIQNLRNENQVIAKELFGLIGTTKNGNSVLFPNSLQRGYTDELTPISERPKMLCSLIGIVGYFSDGNFNYLPAYNQGKDIAKEVKINVLANQTWNMTQKAKQQDDRINHLEEKLKEFESKLNKKDSN